MRQLTKQRMAEKRQADKLRATFLFEFPNCWLCNRPMSDIHELTPGAGRRRGYCERATWISTCRECHESKLQPFQEPWNLAGQLALKSQFDLEHYSRLLVLDIKDAAGTFVTEVEVLAAVWVSARVHQLER